MKLAPSYVLAAAAAVALVSSAGCAQEDATASVSVQADALIYSSQITRMTLTAGPNGPSTDLLAEGGTFRGTMVVPAGTYLFEVLAYQEATMVARGSASATVAEGAITALNITVIDQTGQAPTPKHSPFLTSLTVSNVQPVVGEAVTLTAVAVDPDADPIAFAWTSTCGDAGAFSQTDAASVTWTAVRPTACSIRLDVTSETYTITRVVNLVAFDASQGAGAIDVTTTFVSNPFIYDVYLGGCRVDRYSQDASCRDAIGVGTEVYVNFSAGQGEPSVTDNCGGTARLNEWGAWTWRAPATPAVCLVTVGVTNAYGLTDFFPVAVEVR